MSGSLVPELYLYVCWTHSSGSVSWCSWIIFIILFSGHLLLYLTPTSHLSLLSISTIFFIFENHVKTFKCIPSRNSVIISSYNVKAYWNVIILHHSVKNTVKHAVIVGYGALSCMCGNTTWCFQPQGSFQRKDADCNTSAMNDRTGAFSLASALRAEFVCNKPEMHVVAMEDFNRLLSRNASQQSICSHNSSQLCLPLPVRVSQVFQDKRWAHG